jgi:hypothetical protein
MTFDSRLSVQIGEFASTEQSRFEQEEMRAVALPQANYSD